MSQENTVISDIEIEHDMLQSLFSNPERTVRKIATGNNESAEKNNSEGGPETQDLIKRTQSLFTALHFLEQNDFISSQQRLLDAYRLEHKVIQKIKNEWDITANLDKIPIHEKKLRAKKLKKICEEYLSYIQQEILPELLAVIPAQTNAEALKLLRFAENVCISRKIVRSNDNKLSEEDWREIDCVYEVSTYKDKEVTKHFSVQTPKGRITHKQLEKIQADSKQSLYLKKFGKIISRAFNLNCYSRFGEGIAALRKNACGYIDKNNNRITTLEQYHHSSPVPYDEEDGVKRLAMSVRDVEQIIEVVADDIIKIKVDERIKEKGIKNRDSKLLDELAAEFNESQPLVIPLTEIRLLSPIRKEFSFLDSQQRQYQQILESFIAFSSCDGVPFEATVCFPDGFERKVFVKPDINFFDFGVNRFRHEIFSDPLQDWINTRGFNDLCDNVINYLKQNNIDLVESCAGNGDSVDLNSQDFIELQECVDKGRKDLKERSEELRDLLNRYEASTHKNKKQLQIEYQNKLIEITSLIEQQHVNEKILLNWRKAWWEKNSEKIKQIASVTQYIDLVNDFAEVQGLYYGRQYNTSENNYCLQKTLVRLNYKIGRIPATGCNDAKDRDGNTVNRVEADEVYRHRNNGYVRFNDSADKKNELKDIQSIVHRSSSTFYGTEDYSAPGTRGYQIDRAGNEHLDDYGPMAKLGKEFYHLPLKLRIQDSLIKIKQIFTRSKSTQQLVEKRTIEQRPAEQPMVVGIVPEEPETVLAAEGSKKFFSWKGIADAMLSVLLVVGVLFGGNVNASENANKENTINPTNKESGYSKILDTFPGTEKKKTDPYSSTGDDNTIIINNRSEVSNEERKEETSEEDNNIQQPSPYTIVDGEQLSNIDRDTAVQTGQFLKDHEEFLKKSQPSLTATALVNETRLTKGSPDTNSLNPGVLSYIGAKAKLSNTF